MARAHTINYEYNKYGWNKSKNRKRLGENLESVEEFLARGGEIETLPLYGKPEVPRMHISGCSWNLFPGLTIVSEDNIDGKN